MKTILVIDDERDVLDIVRSVLKTKGYDVLCAGGGEEGMVIAERDRPDLIIVDLMMPKVSGLEVIKRAKASKRVNGTPIVVLSAVSADQDRPPDFWARGLGVDEFIEKPFDPLDLLGRVEALLRRADYVSARPPGGTTPRPIRSTVDLATAPPEKVVAAYIESWNHKDWETEYACLAEEMTQHYEKSQYIQSRESTWVVEDGGRRRMKLVGVVENTVSGVVAKIVCDKKEVFDGRTWKKRCTATLKKTAAGWKIMRIREVPMTRDETEFGD